MHYVQFSYYFAKKRYFNQEYIHVEAKILQGGIIMSYDSAVFIM